MLKKVILFASIGFVVGVVGLIVNNALHGNGLFYTQSAVSVDEKVTLSRNIQTLELIVPVADVTFIETDEKEITVHLHGTFDEKEEISINKKESSKKAVVTIAKKSFNQSFFNWTKPSDKERKVDVYVPKEQLNQVIVALEVGKLTMDSFIVPTVQITNEVGDIDISNVKTDLLKVVSEIGEINLTNIEGTIDAANELGTIAINQKTSNSDITAVNDIGEIDITFAQSVHDTAFDLQTDLGDVLFEIDEVEKITEKEQSVSGIVGKGTYKVKVSSDIGDITIRH